MSGISRFHLVKPDLRLSIMMFLQFFIWGAWYTVIAVYMTTEGMGDLTHWPFTVNPLAAIIAPFFLGFIADRYFDTEKVYGVLHILGAIFMFMVPAFTGNPTLFIVLLLLYNLCYMPTMGLANTLSFHHMEDQEKEFPMVRVFGTIGWIVAGLVVSFGLVFFVGDLPEGVGPEHTAAPLYLAAGASLLLGLYSFSLPNTPPPAAGEKVSVRGIVGLDALERLGDRPFYVFVIASLLLCIPLAAYYNFTQIFLGVAGFENIAATQTLGQFSEVFFMLLIPFFFIRLGIKWMLLIGMGAWVLRYALFALGAPEPITWMILLGILLHGVCYDFFFVAGQIYVDKKATPAIRGQAQGFIILITYGVGMLIGAQVAGNTYNLFLEGRDVLPLGEWTLFWALPAVFAALVAIFFAFFFHDKVVEEEDVLQEEEFADAAQTGAAPN